MDFFGCSSLKNFAALIVALSIFGRHCPVDGVILCNCSNPGQMFDVDPKAMVPLQSENISDDFSMLTDTNSTKIAMSTVTDDDSTAPPMNNSTLILLDDLVENRTQSNFTILSSENSTLILMDHLPENFTHRTNVMNDSSSQHFDDTVEFASFDALVSGLLNFTSNASDTVSPPPSSSAAMMINETTTQGITDFILDDFTSSSTGISASEDDLSFAAFDSLDSQASNMNSPASTSYVNDQSSTTTESFNDLLTFDNTTDFHNQSNITLILSDELFDVDFSPSNFSTSHDDDLANSTVQFNVTTTKLPDNFTISDNLDSTNSSSFNASQLDAIMSANWSFPVMSHTGKKRSSESSEDSSAETSTLSDISDNITDFTMTDAPGSMNNTNVTLALMSDDLSDSGESSASAVTVTLDQSTTLTRSDDTATGGALSAESSVERQENTHSGTQSSSLAPSSSSFGDSAEQALTQVTVFTTIADVVMSSEDNHTAKTTRNSADGLSITTEPRSSAAPEGTTADSSVDTEPQESAEAGSFTKKVKDPILDISSENSSELNATTEIASGSAELPSSPKSTTQSRKPPTSLVPAFDCQGREEGPYANPHRKCSHYFYLCADDEYFVQFCPANMYYDRTRFLCDGFDNVFDCSGVRHTRPPPAAKTTSSPAVNFDCTERDDGDYEVLSCIEHFVTCFGGKAIPRVCSPGLLFDDNVKQCEFPKYISKCGGHARTTPTTAAVPEDMPSSTVTYNFNCERRQDGAHADPDTPCSRHFFMCSSGRTFLLKCPDNLFFNRNSTECDYRKAVVECKKPTKLTSSTRKAAS